MAQEPLCSSSLGLQSLHCGCAWPQPCLGLSLGFQLTLKSMCNLLSTCGSLSCHQDPLLSLPCSACWAQMPWDCAQVLSKSCAMGTISYSRGCATVSCPCLAGGAQTPWLLKKNQKKNQHTNPPKIPRQLKNQIACYSFQLEILAQAGFSLRLVFLQHTWCQTVNRLLKIPT